MKYLSNYVCTNLKKKEIWRKTHFKFPVLKNEGFCKLAVSGANLQFQTHIIAVPFLEKSHSARFVVVCVMYESLLSFAKIQ